MHGAVLDAKTGIFRTGTRVRKIANASQGLQRKSGSTFTENGLDNAGFA
jgi:hypothetical protein